MLVVAVVLATLAVVLTSQDLEKVKELMVLVAWKK